MAAAVKGDNCSFRRRGRRDGNPGIESAVQLATERRKRESESMAILTVPSRTLNICIYVSKLKRKKKKRYWNFIEKKGHTSSRRGIRSWES